MLPDLFILIHTYAPILFWFISKFLVNFILFFLYNLLIAKPYIYPTYCISKNVKHWKKHLQPTQPLPGKGTGRNSTPTDVFREYNLLDTYYDIYLRKRVLKFSKTTVRYLYVNYDKVCCCWNSHGLFRDAITENYKFLWEITTFRPHQSPFLIPLDRLTRTTSINISVSSIVVSVGF